MMIDSAKAETNQNGALIGCTYQEEWRMEMFASGVWATGVITGRRMVAQPANSLICRRSHQVRATGPSVRLDSVG